MNAGSEPAAVLVDTPARRARREAGAIARTSAAAAGFTVLALRSPPAAGVVGAAALLAVLPLLAVFAVLAGASAVQRWPLEIDGFTVRLEQLVLVPFALRLYLLTPRRARPRWDWPEWALAAFLVLQVLTSLVNAEAPRLSLRAVGLFSLGALGYLAVSGALRSPRRVASAARLFLLATAAAAASGIVAVLWHWVAGSSWGTNDRGRPFGVTFGPDVLGHMAAAGAVAHLVLVAEGSRVLPRRTGQIGLAVCLVGMLVSLTRGAWIGFGVAVLLLLLTVPKAGRGRWPAGRVYAVVLAVGAAALTAAILARPEPRVPSGNPLVDVTERGGEIVEVGTGSGADRVREWSVALPEVLERSPFIGLGTNSFGQRHPNPAKPGFLGNLYVRTLYDSGMLGLLVLLAFLGGVLWPTRLVRRSPGDPGSTVRALTYAGIALAVSYVATDSLLLVWPWLLLGLTRAARRVAGTPVLGYTLPNGRRPGPAVRTGDRIRDGGDGRG